MSLKLYYSLVIPLILLPSPVFCPLISIEALLETLALRLSLHQTASAKNSPRTPIWQWPSVCSLWLDRNTYDISGLTTLLSILYDHWYNFSPSRGREIRSLLPSLWSFWEAAWAISSNDPVPLGTMRSTQKVEDQEIPSIKANARELLSVNSSAARSFRSYKNLNIGLSAPSLSQ